MRNKFNASKHYIDGIRFDSGKEAERYLVLKDKQKRGEIYALQVHKPYVIVDRKRVGKHSIAERKYIPDFVYYRSGTNELVVEDVKGYKKGTPYQLFTLKKALMFEKHGIWVHEV